ncbi:MAG: hypothetical protein EBX39_03005 [Actinobacteria bacterium]|nr:hypothetical protein [Actinomycetota bacterium]
MISSPPTAPERGPRVSSGRPWLDALGIFTVIAVLVTVAVIIGGHGPLSSIASVDDSPYTGSSIFGSWFRFDGRWYDIIATDGYSSPPIRCCCGSCTSSPVCRCVCSVHSSPSPVAPP